MMPQSLGLVIVPIILIAKIELSLISPKTRFPHCYIDRQKEHYEKITFQDEFRSF
jgi:hypothetical protein